MSTAEFGYGGRSLYGTQSWNLTKREDYVQAEQVDYVYE